jgi:hypothetical protein
MLRDKFREMFFTPPRLYFSTLFFMWLTCSTTQREVFLPVCNVLAVAVTRDILEVHISVRGSLYDYLPWVSQNPAAALAVTSKIELCLQQIKHNL